MSNAWIDQTKPGDIIATGEIADTTTATGEALTDTLNDLYRGMTTPATAEVLDAIHPGDDGYSTLFLKFRGQDENGEDITAQVWLDVPSALRTTITNR